MINENDTELTRLRERIKEEFIIVKNYPNANIQAAMVYVDDLIKYLTQPTIGTQYPCGDDCECCNADNPNLLLSKEKYYIITRDRAEYGRRGQYELTTVDTKSHCFMMDDTLGYEYFPNDSTKIIESKHTQ